MNTVVVPPIDFPPSTEMMRLRDMLDVEGNAWHDNSDRIAYRTQLWDGDHNVFSAIYGRYTYGEIELWTRSMQERKEDPIGLDTAEEAMELIRKEVGK